MEQHILGLLARKVADYREQDMEKQPLACVVVESDWPEYEPTWEAIKKRVVGYSDLMPVAAQPIADSQRHYEIKEGYITVNHERLGVIGIAQVTDDIACGILVALASNADVKNKEWWKMAENQRGQINKIAQLESNVAALEESNENWMQAAKEAARQVDLLREQLEPDH